MSILNRPKALRGMLFSPCCLKAIDIILPTVDASGSLSLPSSQAHARATLKPPLQLGLSRLFLSLAKLPMYRKHFRCRSIGSIGQYKT